MILSVKRVVALRMTLDKMLMGRVVGDESDGDAGE